MGEKLFCTCCLKRVTKAQLQRHLAEVERKQYIAAMGRNPTPPPSSLTIRPITGNDIFGTRRAPAQAPVPVPTPVNEDQDTPDNLTSLPTDPCPPLATSRLPRFIPPHSIDDDDFPPGTEEQPNESPQVPDSVAYPSMEASDSVDDHSSEIKDHEEDPLEALGGPDENTGRAGDHNENASETPSGVQDEQNLNDLMDWEYLKLGKSRPSHRFHIEAEISV